MNSATWKRRALLLALMLACATLFFGGKQLIFAFERMVEMQQTAAGYMLSHPLVFVALALYVIVLAMPFVPGAELGLFLLLLFGADIAAVVYLATVAGMAIAYCVGRYVPQDRIVASFQAIGLPKMAQRFANPLDQPQLALNETVTTNRWIAKALRYRCVALGVIINTPGNTFLGGGGGISLAAGLSRIFSPAQFLITVALAVAPVPAAFLIIF